MRCVSAALALLTLAACSAPAADPVGSPAPPPAAGVMLLSLDTGTVRAQTALGRDPLAVAVSADGRTAYVADNDPGDVYALRLPELTPLWHTHVGGAPSGLLVAGASVYVSQYDTGAVAELDRTSGRLLGTRAAGPHPGALALWKGAPTAAGAGFGIAEVGGSLWTDARLPPTPGLKPFWLAPGAPGELLVTAEGSPEDSAAGAVLSVATATGRLTTLAAPRDPDQALRDGGRIFVAAHGDRDVLVLEGRRSERWAAGAQAVAMAVDPALHMLVVVTDADE